MISRSVIRNIIKEEMRRIFEAKREFPQNKIKKIVRLTDRNDHTMAYLVIAKELGDKKIISEFEKILKEQNKLGYLPHDLYEKRYKLYTLMMKKIATTFVNFEDVYQAT